LGIMRTKSITVYRRELLLVLPLIFTRDNRYYHIFVRNAYLFGRVITGFAMPCVDDVIVTRKQT
jgi:hypothetical protein